MSKAKGLGVFNQVHWFGVGDVDECWVISTYWALVAAGIMKRSELPSIHDFRAAAGRPDKPGPTGGNNRNIYRALQKFAPEADVKMVTYGVNSFRHALQTGYIASLSVNSKFLPKYLQFGFTGAHQIAVYFQNGKYFVMNPLAKEGSALLQISEDDLRRAAGNLFGKGSRHGIVGDYLFHAILIKANPKELSKLLGGKLPTDLPRDFNYKVTVRNYLDPWAARGLYAGRHRRRAVETKVDGTTIRR